MGDITFDVGCFVIGGRTTHGTTAGGDSDALCAELELDVSNLFLGEVGDWLCKKTIFISIYEIFTINVILTSSKHTCDASNSSSKASVSSDDRC